MFDRRYDAQVRLLLRCLPEISRHLCFALKGGTAINLFLRDLPRISVVILFGTAAIIVKRDIHW